MNTIELVTAAMKASGATSVRGFAEQVGVTHQAVLKWLNSEAVPTFEQAAELALIAGLHPVRTAAEIRLESKDGAKHRALLRQLATAASVTLMLFAVALPSPAKSRSVLSIDEPESARVVHIMRN